MDESPQLSPEGGESAFKQLMESLIEPEIKARLADGRMQEGDVLYAAQALLFPGGSRSVRLNEEVRGIALVTATRDVAVGDDVSSEDMDGIDEFLLPADDPENAAHVTMLQQRGGWTMAFDFRYNNVRIAEHLTLADDFIASAADALAAERLGPFVENAWGATELLAKAELISAPDERLMNARTHDTVNARYNQHANLGNTEQRYADLLNALYRLRNPARYLRGTLELDVDAASEMLATLRDFRERVEAIRPKRAEVSDSLEAG